MTITIGFWAIPVAIVLLGFVVALIVDDDFREGNSGMLSGCLGAGIVLISIFLASGIVIGKYLSEWLT